MQKYNAFLWSGGLDSTYMIYDALHNESKIITGYTLGGQSKAKAFCELHSRDSIIGLPHFEDRIAKDIIKTCHLDGNWHISFQMHLYMAAHCVTVRALSVNFGYVFGDDALVRIPDFQRIWPDIVLLSAGVKDSMDPGDIPTLKYPIKDVSKKHILEHIPKDILDLTWVCEMPYPTENVDKSVHLFYPEGFAFDIREEELEPAHIASVINMYKFVPCGNCSPCRRMCAEAKDIGYLDLAVKYSPKSVSVELLREKE